MTPKCLIIGGLAIIVISTFLLADTILSGIAQELSSFEKQSIIEDSEVGYTRIFHPGSLIWNRMGRPPDQDDYSVVCWNGGVCGRCVDEWNNGKTEVVFRRRPSLRDYLRLWETLEECAVWTLKSPMEALMRSRLPEENPYLEWHTSEETYRFRFRIGKKEHRFEVYYPQGLKDKRYERILREIDRFLAEARHNQLSVE